MWTASVNENGAGVLQDDTSGNQIIFGGQKLIIGQSYPNRIDMSKAPHGVDDTADKCIPCFIAAADYMHVVLAQQRTVALHCANGRSRTAFSLITFLIRWGNLQFDKACELVNGIQKQLLGQGFDLQRQGVNGSYYDWIQANNAAIHSQSPSQISDGRNSFPYVPATVNNGNVAGTLEPVYQITFKPVSTQRPKRSAPVVTKPVASRVEPPTKKQKTRVSSDELASEEAKAFLRGFPRGQKRLSRKPDWYDPAAY